MSSRAACGREILPGFGRSINPVEPGTCGYPRMKGKRQCVWHWLLKQPADVQERHADERYQPSLGRLRIAQVPKDQCPPGERWCSGCQSFVPHFYTAGTRCKACNSKASHRAMVKKTYGIEPEEYDRLFALQGGKCYICRRTARSRRLAVDHDHETGEVRGLLCSDSERGCNHAILGNIKDLDMARRIVEYLEDPPYERLRRGEKPPPPPTSPFLGSGGTPGQAAPF